MGTGLLQIKWSSVLQQSMQADLVFRILNSKMQILILGNIREPKGGLVVALQVKWLLINPITRLFRKPECASKANSCSCALMSASLCMNDDTFE